MTDPTGHFHIVSGDTGFDPLIERLHSRHIHACRHDSFSPLTSPAAVKPPSAPPEDLLTPALEHLRKLVTNRPKRKKTLISHLRARFDKTATDAAMLDLVDRLCKAGHLSIGEKDAVTYPDYVASSPTTPARRQLGYMRVFLRDQGLGSFRIRSVGNESSGGGGRAGR